jgi:hypothetical protein
MGYRFLVFGTDEAFSVDDAILFTGWSLADPLIGGDRAVHRAAHLALLQHAVNILLEGMPAGSSLGGLDAALRALPEVVQVHDLHVWTHHLGHRCDERAPLNRRRCRSTGPAGRGPRAAARAVRDRAFHHPDRNGSQPRGGGGDAGCRAVCRCRQSAALLRKRERVRRLHVQGPLTSA